MKGMPMPKTSRKAVSIPISKLSPNPNQRPIQRRALNTLANSMDVDGLFSPIGVLRKASGYEVVYGGHRLEAAKMLEWEEIEAVIIAPEASPAAGASENLHRADATVLERAVDLKRYAAHHLPKLEVRGGNQPNDRGISKIARKLGFSTRTVGRAFKIAKLEPSVQTMVQEQNLDDNAAFLERLSSLPNEAARIQAVGREKKGSSKTKVPSNNERKNPPTTRGISEIKLSDVYPGWKRSTTRTNFRAADLRTRARFVCKVSTTAVLKAALELKRRNART
jgi:ParB family chromosome partitioning protein